jgi:hypothetical protein
MADIFQYHKGGFWTPAHKRSLYLGLLLVVLSLIVQINAGHYSSQHAVTAAPASDLFLDNLPVVNMDFMIVGGIIVFWFLACGLLALRPRYLLFGVKAIALYIIVRAFFISLTHIGIYPLNAMPDSGDFGFRLYHLTTYPGNFFFSGHTGFPFLMALIFWDNTFWRRFFIAATIAFGISVLLAHVHYSIDVFAAPFIVYGVFVITAKVFPRDYALFDHEAL